MAVVNHDLSYHYRGKEIHIGKNLVSSLNKSDSLNYHDVSSHIADAGLKNGKYYMIVTIPSNFSSNATSLLGRNPKQLHIYYHISSGRNFIVSKMTAGAANAVEIKISDQVTKMYTQVLLSTISKVSKGMQTASIGNNTLATGTSRLEIGANKTIVGSHQLQSGIMSMQSSLPGNSQTIPIKKGLVGLANGATKIDTALSSEIMGLTALNKGNIFVASKLTAGAQQLSRITDKSKNASYLASPVKATTTDDAKVPNNGTGMAPFAIAIGLFVGGIAVGTMYDAYTPGKKPNSFLTWWSAKMLIVGSVGLTQATILYFIMTRVIDLTAKSNINLFLLLIVGSLTFLSIIFCLRILLGGFGTWLITIILVLQLSASSGLYPIQLTSHFASSLTPFLPMTYLIDGLRHAISLGGSIGTDLYVMFFVILLTQMLILIKFFISVRTNKFSFMNSVALKDKVKNNG
ncbi:ABC transporter permease [Lactiplantibacillus plantarum]|uniref:YhgE/Pip family protein n=1 Tax=Lactiplantibacillus plantarum TaxID=1590 RepID=UPI001558B78C|nr:YhgE/Pip family protein [Lactiplantibacillus plantarum]QJS45092.1 ABC transporter permease [Lactiplantibacillus plantarum]